ncbi:MAG TPA: aconitase/3-isopropylmalate dehydratase large subunit family protein, partial [Clostridiales bacterium]|nr:aconitase/3-isopropylmalate dehydratase large subunit family protein [Clostridiales bacterium]
TCTYGALSAFSTGVGSTDMACAMATGKLWFKVPSALKFVLKNKPAKWVSGKDIILHIIGKIGVDGALYKSMEFTGDGVSQLSVYSRLTMANMAIEAGGKNGIFEADDKTLAYIKEHSNRKPVIYKADPDAAYDAVYEIDLSKLRPTVAFPHLPENTRTIDDVGEVKIDQTVIGSCTNGQLEDLAVAAEILKGKKIAKGVRCIVIPATQRIWLEAMEKGYLKTFIDAGCAVSTPTCGPCLGGHMGILAKGERAVATTNRNFVGRMGHPESEVYLASPAVAAASAILGKLASPEAVE